MVAAEPLKPPPKKHKPPLNTVFYLELIFVVLGLVLGSLALLISRPPLFLWLPSVFLLLGAALSLASLVYLNRGYYSNGASNLTLYALISLLLIVLRIICGGLLLLALFSPHSHPPITVPLFGITILHIIFAFYAIGKVTAYRSRLAKKAAAAHGRHGNTGIEEIQVSHLASSYNLLSRSSNTLCTVLDDQEELLVP
ncbi:unnamed protein product, partial [Mesorhabditis spiculigera]